MKTHPVLPVCLRGVSRSQEFALAVGMLMLGLVAPGPAASEKASEEVFKLRSVSAFDLAGAGRPNAYFVRGQSADCQDKPMAAVKSYPAFKSKKPIYGSVRFGGDYGEKDSGILFHFALDESRGTRQGYDRLYFDLNRDLNLRKETALAPQKNPPAAAKLNYSGTKQEVIFEPVLVDFDFGPEGIQKVELVPRLAISTYSGQEYKSVTFVRTRLYEGEIKMGGEAFKVLLGNDYFISGRLDQPGSALILSSQGKTPSPQWWGGDRLMAMHNIKGQYYTFSANPTGDKLTVRPYAGDFGAFEVGPGNRKLDKLSVNGSLQAKDKAVAVGTASEDSWPKAARSCQLPVGDYLPSYLTIEFGRLRINVSQNYHSEGKPRDRAARPAVYGFHVQKDKPCVLDFSNQPEVMFASPAGTERLKPGDTLSVKAVLVDPKLDIMIRGLEDSTRKQTNGPDGKPLGYERNVSLDPLVVVTRANGEKVAEGPMPFG